MRLSSHASRINPHSLNRIPKLSHPPIAYASILITIYAGAAGPIYLREAQLAGVPSLYIITARLFLTTLILYPFIWHKNKANFHQLTPKDWGILLLAGSLFAINLLCLLFALEYTTVVVTGVLRRTATLWTIMLEIVLLGAVFSRKVWAGLTITLLGTMVVGVAGATALSAGSQPVLGAGIALLGAMSMGCYMIIGRSFRHRLPTLAYSWLVFLIAGIFTFIATIATHTPLTGYSWQGYGWVIVVTIVTQFMGHIPINISLRYFPATYLSIVMQLAVILGGVMAFFRFGELPTPWQWAGSAAVLIGVTMVSSR
jgi:drug/metabolite transporter (DMT)-like permease